MTHSINVASIQLDVTPAAAVERLARAEEILRQAAIQSADLAVLPELFNTGYAYIEENYQRAEAPDGPTITWMKRMARSFNLHLAGSLLLRDAGEIYNSLMIVSPDGESWRYDKRYPFIWERRYFRPGSNLRVAHTALGDLGMLICIDSTHLNLWREHAGKVDMMVIASCPPHTGDFTYHFPSGEVLTTESLGRVMLPMRRAVPKAFTQLLEEQAAWLGVPVVNSVACGRFDSPVPDGRQMLTGMLLYNPSLYRYLPQADGMRISANMLEGCRIIGMDGKLLAERKQAEGEGFALAAVELPARKQAPVTPQPRLPLPGYAVWMSDLMAWMQRKAYKQQGSKKHSDQQ